MAGFLWMCGRLCRCLVVVSSLCVVDVHAAAWMPKDIDDGWEVSSPERVGMASEPLYLMAQIVRSKYLSVDSVLVVRNDKLVFEKYFNDARIKKPHPLASAGKSIIAALIGISIGQGNIKSEEQSIYSLLPYRQYENWSSDKRAIRLKHVLTMTAGWDCGDGSWYGNRCGNVRLGKADPNKWILDLPMAAKPGEQFGYTDAAPALSVMMLVLSTKVRYEDYYYQNLLEPLGIRRPKDVNSLTSRDMAKFGLLYLRNGLWQGKQLVPQAWVEKSMTAQFEFKDQTGFAKAYGYFGWIRDFHVDDQLYPAYMAAGNGGQFIVILPRLDLVVVTTGRSYNEDGKSDQELELIERFVIPAAVRQTQVGMPASEARKQ